MVGPNYKPPKLLIPNHFKEAKKQIQIKPVPPPDTKCWKPIQPQKVCAQSQWWTIFNDPTLNDLEDQLNRYNQNVANAYTNYRQALAIVDQARAGLFPTITSAFNLFRQKQGGGTATFITTSGDTTTTGTAATSARGFGLTTTTYSTFLSASWEPDLWGAVGRTIEADVAVAQSDAALLAVTRLSAQGALAQYYFELRTLDRDQRLLDDTVRAYQQTLRLTQNQYKAGVAARSDIVQAQAQLQTQQALALNNGILRGQYEHAIAVLMGRPPAYLNIQPMPLVVQFPKIPLEIPTVWLERRPDVAQAERLVQQASALIGVAIAAYFPTLTLTGTASAAGNSLHQLVHTPSLGWTAGLQLAETIFDAGFRAATVRAAKATYFAQVAAYRQAVLTAFQDVEDNLIALRILRQQLRQQQMAANSATTALRLITNQYKAGTVNFTSVLTAQIAAFTAQKTANDDAGLLMSAEVGLIKALGGGWDCHNQT